MRSLAEAFDRGEDIVGAFDPAKGLGVGVVDVDEGVDVVFELLLGGVAGALIFLSVNKAKKRATWLIQEHSSA